MFPTKFVEEIKTHFMFNNSSGSGIICDILWKKYGTARQATYYNLI
jgi:hypothetical protein